MRLMRFAVALVVTVLAGVSILHARQSNQPNTIRLRDFSAVQLEEGGIEVTHFGNSGQKLWSHRLKSSYLVNAISVRLDESSEAFLVCGQGASGQSYQFTVFLMSNNKRILLQETAKVSGYTALPHISSNKRFGLEWIDYGSGKAKKAIWNSTKKSFDYATK